MKEENEKTKMSKEDKKVLKKKERKAVLTGFKYLGVAKFPLFCFLALNLIRQCGNFVYPAITAKVVTSLTEIDLDNALKYTIIMTVLGFLLCALYVLSLIIWKKFVQIKVSQRIEKDLISAMLDFKISNFDKQQTGAIQSRVDNDSIDMIDSLDGVQYYFFKCLINIGSLVFVFLLNKMLGLILLFSVILVGTLEVLLEKNTDKLRKEYKKSNERVKSALAETVRGIRDIKILDAKENTKNILFRKVQRRDHNAFVFRTIRNSSFSGIDALQHIVTGVLIILGIKLIKDGNLTAASLITIYMYKDNAFNSVTQFAYLTQTFADFKTAATRAFVFFDDELAPKEKFGTREVNNVEGKISFKNVRFGYNDERTILNDLSFDVEPKKTIALVGESGCGKTTTLALLSKSYELPENNGHIYIDDIDINEFDEKSLRKAISIITQTPYIFNMSIKDNLRLVKADATDEEIENVCIKARLDSYIENLPDKYDTLLGEGGLNLSGGQRQRLAIARALLKECKIMLFDEATSALDNVTQKEIKESIDALSSEHTIIIVAHRLSTIKDADKIFMIENGKIRNSGTHDELMNDPAYSYLYTVENEI